MHHLDWQRYAAHTLLALGVSGLLLALLARFSLAAADTSLLPRMVAILTAISATSLLLYLAAIGARTVFQALRYRLILGATEDSVPGFFHLLLVTASRTLAGRSSTPPSSQLRSARGPLVSPSANPRSSR